MNKKQTENLIIGCKIDKELKELLNKVVELRGEDLSSFIRRAIKKELLELGYLTELESKALGVNA